MVKGKVAAGATAPTMATVAAAAGVSKITVSRALRGSELVRPELRERIVRLAGEAGYRMNVAARSLRTRRSRTVAVVIEQFAHSQHSATDPLLLTMIGGLFEVLTPADHAMLLMTYDHFIQSNAVGADGVVVLGQGEGGRSLMQAGTLGLPLVAWGEPVPGLDVAVIGSDNRQGGRLAAEHLVQQGRQRLLFLGDPRHPEVAGRLHGVREVLSETRATLVGVSPCAFAAESGTAAVKDAIESGVAFDAIVAVSDFIAAGACDELMARGIEVPAAVSIVGFDDTPIAATHRPSLTSVRQDADAAGRALGNAILSLLGEVDRPAVGTPLPVELVVRDSSRG